VPGVGVLLVPRSPDFDPVELGWSEMKAALKDLGAHSRSAPRLEEEPWPGDRWAHDPTRQRQRPERPTPTLSGLLRKGRRGALEGLPSAPAPAPSPVCAIPSLAQRPFPWSLRRGAA
jgi:hypothetical protein